MLMRKRLLSFLMSMFVIVPCFMMLTACGGDPPPPAKTLQYIEIDVVNTNLEVDGPNIYYTYGETVSLSKSDFKVTANYDDSTSEEVTDYTIDTSAMTSTTPDVGYYTVPFDYQGRQEYIYINVDFALIAAIDDIEDVYVEYNGEEQDIMSTIDSALQESGKPTLTSLIDSGKVVLSSDSVTSATNAGHYTIDINPTGNYAWEDVDNGYTTGNKIINWEVKPKELAIPVLSEDTFVYKHYKDESLGGGSFIYRGVAQKPDIDFGDTPRNIITIYDNDNEIVEDISSQTDAGHYTMMFEIKEEYRDNYVFADNNYWGVNVHWDIEEMMLVKPTLVQDTFVYQEGSRDIEVDNIDGLDFIVASGDTTFGDAREHRVTYCVGEDLVESGANYKWIDNEDADYQDKVTLTYTVTRATFTAPNTLTNSTIVMYGQYSGITYSRTVDPNYFVLFEDDHESTFSRSTIEFVKTHEHADPTNIYFKDESYDYLNNNGMIRESALDYNDCYYEIADTPRNRAVWLNKAGTYKVDLNFYKNKINYNPITIEMTIIIERYAHRFYGEWNDESGASYVFSGGEYAHTFNVYDEVFGLFATETSVMSKGTTENNYTTIIYNTEDCKEVGYYRTVSTIEYKEDTDGVSFAEKVKLVDGEGNDVDLVQTNTWTITPYMFNLFDRGDFDTNFNDLNSFYYNSSNYLFYNEDYDWDVSYENLSWMESYYMNLDLSYYGENVENLILNNASNAPGLIYEKYDNNEWVTTTSLKEIGKYRVMVDFQLRPNVMLENVPTFEFEVIEPEVDLSNVEWKQLTSETLVYSNEYYEKYVLDGVPAGVKDITETRFRDAGNYTKNGVLQVPTYVTVTGADDFTAETVDNIVTYTTNSVRQTIVEKFVITKAMLDVLFEWDYTEPYTYDGDTKRVTLKLVDTCPTVDSSVCDQLIFEKIYTDLKYRSAHYSVVYGTDANAETATEVGTYTTTAHIKLTENQYYSGNVGYDNYRFNSDCYITGDIDPNAHRDSISMQFTITWEIKAAE